MATFRPKDARNSATSIFTSILSALQSRIDNTTSTEVVDDPHKAASPGHVNTRRVVSKPINGLRRVLQLYAYNKPLLKFVFEIHPPTSLHFTSQPAIVGAQLLLFYCRPNQPRILLLLETLALFTIIDTLSIVNCCQKGVDRQSPSHNSISLHFLLVTIDPHTFQQDIIQSPLLPYEIQVTHRRRSPIHLITNQSIHLHTYTIAEQGLKMPRLLIKISTRNRIKARAYKQPKLPSERLWLSITGLSSPYPVTAALSRTVNPPEVISRPAVATLASSLSGRPAFIEVKPQLKKRKRDETPASPATTTSSFHDDDDSSVDHDVDDLAAPEVQEVPIDPALFEIEGTPIPEQTIEVLTPPSSSSKRQRVSLDLGASSVLLSPAEERPADAKFSPGQVLWASSMLSAVMDGKVLAGEEYKGADCSFLVQAVRNGALEVEKDSVVEMGMDGHARDENMEKFDALLGECLKKEEVVVVEEEVIGEESSEEEMSDVEELVEDAIEYDSDDEEVAEEVPIAAEDSSSSDDDEVAEAPVVAENSFSSDDDEVAEEAPVVAADSSSSDDEVYSSSDEED